MSTRTEFEKSGTTGSIVGQDVVGDMASLDELEAAFGRGASSASQRMGLRVFLDDERSPSQVSGLPEPSSWTTVRGAEACIDMLRTGRVLAISLDHDLGPGPTGYEVARWLEEAQHEGRRVPKYVFIHSMNPVGVRRMKQALLAFRPRILQPQVAEGLVVDIKVSGVCRIQPPPPWVGFASINIQVVGTSTDPDIVEGRTLTINGATFEARRTKVDGITTLSWVAVPPMHVQSTFPVGGRGLGVTAALNQAPPPPRRAVLVTNNGRSWDIIGLERFAINREARVGDKVGFLISAERPPPSVGDIVEIQTQRTDRLPREPLRMV